MPLRMLLPIWEQCCQRKWRKILKWEDLSAIIVVNILYINQEEIYLNFIQFWFYLMHAARTNNANWYDNPNKEELMFKNENLVYKCCALNTKSIDAWRHNPAKYKASVARDGRSSHLSVTGSEPSTSWECCERRANKMRALRGRRDQIWSHRVLSFTWNVGGNLWAQRWDFRSSNINWISSLIF